MVPMRLRRLFDAVAVVITVVLVTFVIVVIVWPLFDSLPEPLLELPLLRLLRLLVVLNVRVFVDVFGGGDFGVSPESREFDFVPLANDFNGDKQK